MSLSYINGKEVAKIAGCWDMYMTSQQKVILNELTPEHIHFDWPEYTYRQPAVDYTQRAVFLYKKEVV